MKEFLPFVIVGLVSGSVYGLAGVGLVLTYKTSGVFNFAQGSVAAAVAFAFYQLRTLDHVPWPIAAIVCLLVVAPLMGLGLEAIARRIGDAPAVTKIVATIGMLVAIDQLAIIRYGAQTRQFPAFLPTRVVHIAGVSVGIDQLIVMAIALGSTAGLYLLFRRTRLGLNMRAVVDSSDLVSLGAVNPVRVRRWAWIIGSSFAGLSGLLLAPTIGLDAGILTFLVVQAFGACAIGLFTSLPLTYVGGLAIGVAAALSSKYVASVSWLGGLPPSLPFIVLFSALILVPRRKLVDISNERRPRVDGPRIRNNTARTAVTAAAVAVLLLVPLFAGTKITVYSEALPYVLVFLSVSLLERTSGQISLAQLGFAAVGAAAFSHFAHGLGLPWPIAVLLAGLIAVPVGALVAIPAIRLSGLYLALATFGFALLLQNLFYNTSIMFFRVGTITPRPSFASSDTSYYYLLLLIVAAGLLVVALTRRARLGRLLNAMADSPVALATYGTSTTVIKVVVFCLSAFLAGIGGAVLGPVTGQIGPMPFFAVNSLMLVVILALQVPFGELTAPFAAAFGMVVLPSYLSGFRYNQWLSVLFGVGAIAIATRRGSRADVTTDERPSGARSAAQRRPRPGAATLRVLERARPEARVQAGAP
ncbi:MAG: branched-chain amino acid ABC transporter permease [Acidimicrobiales bacterium]